MSFVAIIPDRAKGQASDFSKGDRATMMSDVRRPTRGIQLKEDSYATLRVVLGDGRAVLLRNGGSRTAAEDENGIGRSSDYSNFMIQAVTEERVEKQQIVETFGEAFIFFFGERPRVLSIQGVLINTFDFNWEAEWWWNYENYLRGTKCVETGARVYLVYDQTMVVGYIMATGSTKQAVERNHVPFQFQLFVTDYIPLSEVGDTNANQTHQEPVPKSELYQHKFSEGPSKWRPYAAGRVALGQSGFGLISLIGKMASQIGAAVQGSVTGARTMARGLANMANMPAAYLDMFVSNPVRVPMGFAGSLVFDETNVTISPGWTGSDRPITYTSFGDNADEFVSLTPYYASSSIDLGNALARPFTAAALSDTANAMTKKGYDQWRAYGLIPPNDIVSNSLQLIAQNPYGMMLLKGVRNQVAKVGAKVSTSMNQAIDQAESKIMPIAAGTQAVLGGIATADRVATNVDRSFMNFDVPSSSIFVNAKSSTAVGGQQPQTLEAALAGATPAGGPPGTLSDALNGSGLTAPVNPVRAPSGPVSTDELKGVALPIAGPTTMVSVVPPGLLPANANQMLLNPMQNPAVSALAFQTLQPLTSAPIPMVPINTFGQK